MFIQNTCTAKGKDIDTWYASNILSYTVNKGLIVAQAYQVLHDGKVTGWNIVPLEKPMAKTMRLSKSASQKSRSWKEVRTDANTHQEWKGKPVK